MCYKTRSTEYSSLKRKGGIKVIFFFLLSLRRVPVLKRLTYLVVWIIKMVYTQYQAINHMKS